MDVRIKMWHPTTKIREKIYNFLQNLNIITSYKKEFIVIDKKKPRIYRIPKETFLHLQDNSCLSFPFIKDYYNLRRWVYLPDDRKIKQYNNWLPPVLSLRISEDCNLKCRYCYNKDNMLNAKGIRYMSKNTAKEALICFLSRFKNKEITIVFYGGEPLLNFSTIKYILDYAKRFKDRSIEFKIVTNGTIMNKDILQTIIGNNISVMVSLDFPPSEHNRNRPFKNGNPSFDKIKKNLLLLTKNIPSKNLIVKTVIAKDSNFSLNQIYDNFYKSVIPTENFVFESEFVGKTYQGKEPIHIKEQKIESQKKSIIKNQRQCILNDEPSRLYKKEVIGSPLDIIINGREPLGDCVALNNAICVNPLGNMYFCDVVANRDEFYLGNIKAGIDETRFKGLKEKYLFKPKECLSCWASSFCSGFCPLSRPNKESRELNCKETKMDFIDDLKFFLSLNYSQIQQLAQYVISATDDKEYIQSQIPNLKVCLEIYKMLNQVNRYIKPVNILPY